MQVRTPIHVRYGETDKMGVVYHANYLIYFEDARCDFLEAMGFSYAAMEEAGCLCPVREIALSYNEPLRYGDAAFVVTEVTLMKPTRAVYHQALYKDGMDPAVDRPCVEADVMVCFVRAEDFKPTSFKRYFPDLYERYRAVVRD